MEQYEIIINYNDKKEKKISKNRYKRMILAALLAGITAVTSYTVVDVVKNGIDAIEDTYHYNKESKAYHEMVNKEFYHVMGTSNLALDVGNIANDFKQLSFKDKDDVYHGIIECVRFFRFNLDENFRKFLNNLDLNEMSKENSLFPSEAELYQFLENHDFIKEDGSIDFDAWRDYDKEVFNMERELKEFKENGK